MQVKESQEERKWDTDRNDPTSSAAMQLAGPGFQLQKYVYRKVEDTILDGNLHYKI